MFKRAMKSYFLDFLIGAIFYRYNMYIKMFLSLQIQYQPEKKS